jgi:hypothetical protein
MDHLKIDNATKMFFHDLMVRFAVWLESARPDAIEDECGDDESKKDSNGGFQRFIE